MLNDFQCNASPRLRTRLATSRLLIINQNDIVVVLMSYHNTLLKQVKRS